MLLMHCCDLCDCQAAEKLQDNGAVRGAEDQLASVLAGTTSVMSTWTVTTTNSSTVAVLVESQQDTQSKITCSQSGTELSLEKSNALASTVALTTVSQSWCCSGPGISHPPLKLSSELQGRDKPGAEKAGTTQLPASSLSHRTTDTSPQISMKMAKSRRGQKIGQPQETVNSVPQSAGQKNTKQPVVTSCCVSSTSAAATASKCVHLVGSHLSSTKSGNNSQAETSSNVVTHLRNKLVDTAGKACRKVDHLSQTDTSSLHGRATKPTSQLLNGLRVHVDTSPIKTSRLSQSGSNPQCGSKPGTQVTNGPASGCTSKTSWKTDIVAGGVNGHTKASASSDTSGQSSSVIDTGLQANGHTDQMTTSTAAKSRKARRKARGKEALTSVG